MDDFGTVLMLALSAVAMTTILRAWGRVVKEYERGQRSLPSARALRGVFAVALLILIALIATAFFLATIDPLAVGIPVFLSIALIGVVGSLYLATRQR